jgi:hypothetical protein
MFQSGDCRSPRDLAGSGERSFGPASRKSRRGRIRGGRCPWPCPSLELPRILKNPEPPRQELVEGSLGILGDPTIGDILKLEVIRSAELPDQKAAATTLQGLDRK